MKLLVGPDVWTKELLIWKSFKDNSRCNFDEQVCIDWLNWMWLTVFFEHKGKVLFEIKTSCWGRSGIDILNVFFRFKTEVSLTWCIFFRFKSLTILTCFLKFYMHIFTFIYLHSIYRNTFSILGLYSVLSLTISLS